MDDKYDVIDSVRAFVLSSELLHPIYYQTMEKLKGNALKYGWAQAMIGVPERMHCNDIIPHTYRPKEEYAALYLLFKLQGFRIDMTPKFVQDGLFQSHEADMLKGPDSCECRAFGYAL